MNAEPNVNLEAAALDERRRRSMADEGGQAAAFVEVEGAEPRSPRAPPWRAPVTTDDATRLSLPWRTSAVGHAISEALHTIHIARQAAWFVGALAGLAATTLIVRRARAGEP